MSEHSNSKSSKGRLVPPPRKGFWLFDYWQVKYDTPFQRTAGTILGSLALVSGAFVLWAAWSKGSGTWMSVIFAVAAIAYGLIITPVGIIYWSRRWRGEPTDYFDYEAVNRGKEKHRKEVDDAADHR